jgi:transposase InsO family protein
MEAAFGCGQSGPITSGATISLKHVRTTVGALRLLTMIDEFTRECLAIRVARRLNSAHVIEMLGDCMLEHGLPEHVRSDNGAEMTARRVRSWLETVGTH